MTLMWCSCNYLKLILLKYALLFPDSLCLNGDYSHELVAMSINESKGISQILSNCTTGHCHFRKQNKLTKSLTVLLLFFLLFSIARHASQHEACTPVILNSFWSVFSISYQHSGSTDIAGSSLLSEALFWCLESHWQKKIIPWTEAYGMKSYQALLQQPNEILSQTQPNELKISFRWPSNVRTAWIGRNLKRSLVQHFVGKGA